MPVSLSKATDLTPFYKAAYHATFPSQETPMEETTYSFQPLTPAHRTADHYLDTWIQTMQERHDINTVWGRIIRTNINYIVTGYNTQGQWTQIPCANLSTAKLYLGRIMPEDTFKLHTQFWTMLETLS